VKRAAYFESKKKSENALSQFCEKGELGSFGRNVECVILKEKSHEDIKARRQKIPQNGEPTTRKIEEGERSAHEGAYQSSFKK